MPATLQSHQLRILVLRLSPLPDVAASATHLFLADAVSRALPAAAVSLAFLPPPGRPIALASFDLVLVSNSFVLEAINLPWLLVDGGVAPWAGDRPEGFPPIVLGGSNALAAQCLVRPDANAVPDVFFFGEGETALAGFLRAWADGAGRRKRDRLLAAAAAVEGFWVTGAWPAVPVVQAVFRGVSPPPCHYPLLDTDAADTVRLQASYGCPAFCSFCFEGMERKPYRELSFDALMARARELKRYSGARAVELDAFNLNSHRDLAALVTALVRLFDRVGFKSQRVDVLAAVPALLELELAAGKRSFTLGLEGISARLRARLNKSLEDQAIDRILRRLLSERVREVKLFYLVTGDETGADLDEFDGFCRRLAGWVGAPERSTRIVCSFGRLVRMPNTPLRYDRLHLDRAAWDALTERLERSCRGHGFEWRLALSWDEYRATQLLAAADYRVAALVVALAREGFHYAGRLPAAYAERLSAVMAAAGLLSEAALADKPRSHEFPFAFVRTPVSPDFLFAQYEAALAADDRGYCLGDACRQCGACASPAERAALLGRPRVPEVPKSAVALVSELTRAKQRLEPVYRRVRLGAEFAGRGSAWVSARLLQAYLAACPDAVENVLSIEEWLFTGTENARERFPQPAGETVVAIRAWTVADLADPAVLSGTDSAVTWLGTVPACAPGGFVAATWRLEVACQPRAAARVADDWLRSAHLPCTLRRDGDTSRFELAPAALRKRVLSALTCRPTAAGAELELTVHPKADLKALVRALECAGAPVVATCLGCTLPS